MDKNGRKTILAVGAHTGDTQLTCGLLLAKHAMEGDHVVIVDLTAGQRGAPAGSSVSDFREANICGAGDFAAALGGESIVLDTPDGELYPNRDIELRLAGIMREKQADAILCHWKNSLHKDHIAAHTIACNAYFYASLPTFEHPLPPAPIRRCIFAENWEDAEGFEPYFFFDVSQAFSLWKEAVRKLWLSEHSPFFKYLRYYEALSVVRGALIGRDHATAFAAEKFAQKLILEQL
jgi:LmbE family N-acetylglucosaminyl deacetylase